MLSGIYQSSLTASHLCLFLLIAQCLCPKELDIKAYFKKLNKDCIVQYCIIDVTYSFQEAEVRVGTIGELYMKWKI